MNKWANLAEEYFKTEDDFEILVQCVSKRPEEYAAQLVYLEKDKAFYSGVLVALQSVVGFGEDTIADEIVSGLGSGILELVNYANSEGGVDQETVEYLKRKGIIS
jgi:hypothetical protein